MELNTPRGMRDMPPGQQIYRQELVRTLQKVFERYGFDPLETPVLERFDILSSKFSGGAEILKETFQLTDQGKRKLALRYDLTVPLARFIAMNPTVKLPFKRYQIERVYRDGPIKLGRYREFYQCDCDIVGPNSAAADAQCIQVGTAVFKQLNIPVRIEINNVSLLKNLLIEEGVPENKLSEAMIILDKLKKIGHDAVLKEMKAAKIPVLFDRLFEAAAKKTNKARVKALQGVEGIERVEEVLAIAPDVEFNPALSRGLSYYTGMVYEAYGTKTKVTSSLCGGGRYDNMIGDFIGNKTFPAVGISFGLEPIMDVLAPEDTRKSVTQVYVIPIKTLQESSEIAETLRGEGINTDIDLAGRSISKNLDYANQKGIPFVIILGKRELESKTCTIKDMTSGEETAVSIEKMASVLKERI